MVNGLLSYSAFLPTQSAFQYFTFALSHIKKDTHQCCNRWEQLRVKSVGQGHDSMQPGLGIELHTSQFGTKI